MLYSSISAMRLHACLLAALSFSVLVVACADDSEDDPLRVKVADGKGGSSAKGGSGGKPTTNAGAGGDEGTAGTDGEAGAGGDDIGTSGTGGKGGGSGGTAGKAGASGKAGSGGTSSKGGTGGAGGASGADAGGEGGSSAGEGGSGAGEGGSDAGGSAGAGGGTGTNATVETITKLANGSACAKYSWKDRGKAPPGYIKGVALVYARAVCDPTRSDLVVVSQAKTGNDEKDALSWFNSNFNAVGMKNDVAGIDTMRHAFTLLTGLGMRESSGEHCCGRDASADNVASESAEAGLYQTSYDSKGASPELPKLFTKYKADTSGCLLDVFKEGVTCSAADLKNWGTGVDGLAFQKLEKDCPAFAAEYAAVMLRVSGGTKGHYGPLRTKAAEIRPECDEMLHQVQDVVQDNPALCADL